MGGELGGSGRRVSFHEVSEAGGSGRRRGRSRMHCVCYVAGFAFQGHPFIFSCQGYLGVILGIIGLPLSIRQTRH